MYGRAAASSTSHGTTTRKDEGRLSSKAQDRLKHLEELVRSLVDSPSQNQPPTENASVLDGFLKAAATTGAPDKDTIDGSSYTGTTHWSAILQYISDLRNDLGTGNAGDDHVAEIIDYSKPDALFGGNRPHSLEQVLSNHLLPRIQIDRRVTQYFNARYVVVPFVHGPQFSRQYEKFWANPLGTNVIWISKMFSICCLAASLNLAASQAPAYKAEIAQQRDSFEAAAGECLVLGNYSKPQKHVVEALALFLQCKYMRSWDPQPEVALMFAVQTRLAYMMGYHRDGSKFPNQISPFETEMRRRVWAMLRQFDMLTAFQLGIPNNVPPGSWDTANPSNLLDADFDEDTEVVPPPRPETEVTPVLYFVVKARIVDVCSRICHHAASFPSSSVPGPEVMALDALLRERADGIPESLRARPMSLSITDPAHEIMIRINISFLWRKALCVLHRKYMIAVENEYSYRTCVEAASAMCESFIDVYPEFQPGGTFGNDGWMLSSFTIIDFLLVTMVLCLATSVSRMKFYRAGGDCESWLKSDETKNMLAILEKSRSICIELGERSREAKRVSGVLDAVVSKLKNRSVAACRAREGWPFFFAPPVNRTVRTVGGVYDRDGISLKPLSLSEQITSVNPSSGMVPPSFFSHDRELYGPSRNQKTDPAPGSSVPTIIPQAPRDAEAENDPSTSRDPLGNVGMDVDTGFIDNFMGDVDGNSTIDWTQLDQFTGFFGDDPSFAMYAPLSAPTTASDFTSAATHITDPESWVSTPLYSLGGRVFDPITGDRRQA